MKMMLHQGRLLGETTENLFTNRMYLFISYTWNGNQVGYPRPHSSIHDWLNPIIYRIKAKSDKT